MLLQAVKVCYLTLFHLGAVENKHFVGNSLSMTHIMKRTITESVCQQHMEAGRKRAKKLSKRRILECEAECGISAFLLLFSPQNAIHYRQKEFFVLAYLHKF